MRISGSKCRVVGELIRKRGRMRSRIELIEFSECKKGVKVIDCVINERKQ